MLKGFLIVLAIVLIIPFTPEITHAVKPAVKQYKEWVYQHISVQEKTTPKAPTNFKVT